MEVEIRGHMLEEHTSIEGLDKPEMLTRQELEANPHTTVGWSGPMR